MMKLWSGQKRSASTSQNGAISDFFLELVISVLESVILGKFYEIKKLVYKGLEIEISDFIFQSSDFIFEAVILRVPMRF